MYVLQIKDDLGYRQVNLFNLKKVVIGRGDGCDVLLKSRFSSRQHATLVFVGAELGGFGHWRVMDGVVGGKRSSNGLFHNGTKVAAANLSSGDLLGFGPDVSACFQILSIAQVEPDNQRTFINHPQVD